MTPRRSAVDLSPDHGVGLSNPRLPPSHVGLTPLVHQAIHWQAIYSRDPRFDGRFFMGATTTGVYCRNICPVPFAKPGNTRLFSCAAAAESAGFRPCKRCRPHAAPGTPAWLGTSAVVNRAFRLILEGALNEGSVQELAARLGLGPRQLSRLFVQHLGVSPLKVAITHRLHLARKLIDESSLPMTQIAFCSGFKSIREFNHAIRSSSGQSPSKLRLASGARESTHQTNDLEIRLPYRKPFDWESLISFLRRRAIPGVELVNDRSYQRTIEICGAPGILTVTPDRAGSRLVVRLNAASYEGLAQTVERIRCMFDLSADPIQIATHLAADRVLRQLVKLRPGLRVPGVWDGFEAAVLAVLGQKLTEPGCRKSVARFVRTFGTPVTTPVSGLRFLFPAAATLARADFTKAGISEPRAIILRKLARAAMSRHLAFSMLVTLEQTVSQLSLFGIDESTANYIAMRALGEPDAFPAEEPELRRKLAGGRPLLCSEEATHVAQGWRPWRAYAAMHLAESWSTRPRPQAICRAQLPGAN